MTYLDPVMRKKQAREAGQRYQLKRTATKIARFEKKIADRRAVPELEKAWAAGLFEGEGTIAICESGGYSRSVVCMSNTDREIVDFFQARWPGLISMRPPTSRHKRAWTWRLQGNYTLGFLEDMVPMFVTNAERAKAMLLIESQRERWAGYRLDGHREKMAKYAAAMRKLNRKGPTP